MKDEDKSKTQLLADLHEARQALERALEELRAGRAQADEALRSAKQRADEVAFHAQLIIDSLTEGLVAVRPDGEILYHNKASFTLHAVDAEHSDSPLVRFREHYPLLDLTGKSLLPEEGPLARTLQGERFQDWELVVKRVDTGTEFVGSFSGTPVYDGRGELLLGIVTLRDITLQKKAEDNLRRAYQDLEKLTGELRRLSWDLDIRQEESRKLAQEIHEELGNALAGARFRLLDLQDQIPAEQSRLAGKTREALDCLDGLFDQVRQISRYLRPPVLDQMGLIAAINWLGDDFQGKTGIQCVVSARGPVAQTTKEVAYASAFYRICQEVLSNVGRHSKAERVEIVLSEDDSVAYLEITDNGQGFEPEDIGKPGVGLLNVRERAGYLGGHLDILTSPGSGTRIRVTVPLPGAEVGRAGGKDSQRPHV